MTGPGVSPLRVAAVFDAVDEVGRPYFSPDRRRFLPGVERDRLVGYLSGAPLVLRAGGFEVDPLDPGRGAVVPVGYRTDGVWVWQEASAYYLESRGVGPEDGLIAHAESVGFVPPSGLSVEVLAAAGDAALAPSPPPEPDTRRVRYFSDVTGGRTADDPGGVLRQWYAPRPGGRQVRIDEAMGRDLRWHPTNAFLADSFVGSDDDVEEISQRQAATVLDRWLIEWSAEETRR